MINNSKEYNKKEIDYNINYLIDSKIDNEISNIIPQTLFLNSDEMNMTLNNIETAINKLYEKTRIVQDLYKYAKYFIEENLHSISADCKSVINTIETDRDKIKSYEYNTIPVIFNNSNSSFDRDGNRLPSFDFENSKLITSGKKEEKIKIKSIEKIKGFTPYRNNISKLSSGKKYRSFYLMDGPGTNGLKETLLITLDKPSIANALKIKTSNCIIESVSYIDTNDNKIMIEKFNGYINSREPIKQIIVSIKCDKYKQKSYAIDISRMQNNFWDKVKEESYRESIGNKSIYDLDKISGMTDNQKDYSEFANDIQSWENEYIKYKIDHNEWEKRRDFFATLKDTIIKGEEDWDDIAITPSNNKIQVNDIFENGKLKNPSIRLAKRCEDGKIVYLNINNMTEKQVRENLACDPNIFLVNGEAANTVASPLKYEKDILTNLYALNDLINKGIYPALKQVIVLDKKGYDIFSDKLLMKSKRILSLVYYDNDNPNKVQSLIDETDGIGIAVVNNSSLKNIDLKNAASINLNDLEKIISKANSISE